MKFIKAQTNGNDFVILGGDAMSFDRQTIRSMADRKFGIGCDQVIFVEEHEKSEKYNVKFFNQDGSEAEMCGNGSCAVGKYIREILNGMGENPILTISEKDYRLNISSGEVSVDFPIPKILKNGVICTGNKHIVSRMNEVGSLDELVKKFGECNLHFAESVEEDSIRLKTFEKGVGWTKACGSGAIASAFLFAKKNRKIKVIHDGGVSFVDMLSNSIKLTTTPKIVFNGNFFNGEFL
ncbi:MAG: hypothetical protein LBT03_01480 [Holosporales bacterium]|nr:hypothetical protein [Holosporales bacterium]